MKGEIYQQQNDLAAAEQAYLRALPLLSGSAVVQV
jgi:cytochrome c-type biogenesis protein CcmH/NrfG